TVERIRAHLGTGSPNTVTRWLETWWSSVGSRLRQRSIEDARPEVPADVMGLAQRCWSAALQSAGEQARRELEAERTLVADEAAQLAATQTLRSQERQELALALAQTAAAQTSIELLRNQLAEASTQSQEVRAQRDGACARAEALGQQLQQLQALAQRQREHDDEERSKLNAHLRATEDRCLLEIDTLRQQLRDLQAQLARAAKAALAQKGAHDAALSAAQAALSGAQRELQVQTALADAHAAQVARLTDLPERMQAALARGPRLPPRQPRTATKTATASGATAARSRRDPPGAAATAPARASRRRKTG
ncbi:DNA-binding protein, partial [Stenotrophomonas sp. HMWF003]|uniref:DNA-binding protein n=1 Tax=Stenotrophomonas sp. HMWF003 TaxID=2056840 RepID=UPI000D4E4890